MSKERLEDAKSILNHLKGYGIHDKGNDVEVFEWLIEQAERVQELEDFKRSAEQLYKNYHLSAKKSVEEKEELREQNKRYREALEFYADDETYEPPEVQIGAVTKEGYKISKYKYDPIINTDKGKKARKALECEK